MDSTLWKNAANKKRTCFQWETNQHVRNNQTTAAQSNNIGIRLESTWLTFCPTMPTVPSFPSAKDTSLTTLFSSKTSKLRNGPCNASDAKNALRDPQWKSQNSCSAASTQKIQLHQWTKLKLDKTTRALKIAFNNTYCVLR